MTSLYASIAQKLRAFRHLAKLTSWSDALRFTLARLRGDPEVKLHLKHPACQITLRPRNSDFDVLLQTFVSGGCDVRALVSGARRIIDGGANIGLTAIQFASHFPEATIIAVEPEPANFDLLVRNTSAFPRVRPLQAAIWPRSANLSVGQAPEDGRSWSFQTHEALESEAGVTCPAVPIDELVSESNPCDVLKLDIEGAEWPLLEQTDLSWMGHASLLVLELHGEDKDARLQRALGGRSTNMSYQHEKVILRRLAVASAT